MLTVISPAKRLNEKPHPLPPGFAQTAPDFMADATKLAKLARGLCDEFSTKDKPHFVAGVLGPTDKTCSISPAGHTPRSRPTGATSCSSPSS